MPWERETGKLQAQLDPGFSTVSSPLQLLSLVLDSQFPGIGLISGLMWLQNALGSHSAGKSESHFTEVPANTGFCRLISKAVNRAEECDGQWT